MLDLNIDAVSVDSFSDENKFLTPIEKKILEYATGADSGTSMSSVVNADETDSSSTFNLDIMFNGPKCDTRSTHELITRQLFPVISGDKDDLELFGSKSLSATSLLRPQWLNLSFPESVVEHQLSVFEDQKSPPPPPPIQPAVRKSRRGPRSRSSQYRGVTFYRRTGRWESHIWDCGKQVYLGGFDTAHAAARAYDRAAVKFRGVDADINFTITDYEDDLKQMKDLTKEEFVHVLRRQSSGFSRGSSKYRGVNLHKCGRWEARNGLFLGKKYMYLGLFNSEIEAARAYDEAVIESKGREALTNFEPSTYEGQLSLVNKNQDIHRNLDLNLWISPPSGVKKGIGNVRGSHLHDSAYQLPDGKRTKAESFASAPMGGETPHSLSMEMNYLSTWPGIYSGPLNYVERAIGKNEAEAVPLPEFSNWAWQMNGEGVVNRVPLFSTAAAASSGFSSTTTTTTTPPVFSGFSHLLPLNTQNKKLCLPTPANASSFYYSDKN